MPDATIPQAPDQFTQARKKWVTPEIIVAEIRDTEGGTTRFTDGTSLGVPYGS